MSKVGPYVGPRQFAPEEEELRHQQFGLKLTDPAWPVGKRIRTYTEWAADVLAGDPSGSLRLEAAKALSPAKTTKHTPERTGTAGPQVDPLQHAPGWVAGSPNPISAKLAAALLEPRTYAEAVKHIAAKANAEKPGSIDLSRKNDVKAGLPHAMYLALKAYPKLHEQWRADGFPPIG